MSDVPPKSFQALVAAAGMAMAAPLDHAALIDRRRTGVPPRARLRARLHLAAGKMGIDLGHGRFRDVSLSEGSPT